MRLLVIPLLSLAYAACNPTYTASTVNLRHSVNVFAPSGPAVSGSPLPRRAVGLEAAVSAGANNTGDATVSTGGLGHRNADVAAALRILHRAGPVELGATGEFTVPGGTPATAGLTTPSNSASGRVGVVARLHFVERPTWTLGLNTELLLALLAFRTDVRVVDRSTPTSQCETASALARWGSVVACEAAAYAGAAPGASTVGWSGGGEGLRPHLSARVGLFAGGRLGERVWLLGGFLAQNVPWVRASEERTYQCRTTRGSCVPEGSFQPSDESTFLGTAWLGVGIDVGAVSLYAQAHGNVVGDAAVIARSPFGLTFGARYVIAR
ncbi:MAG: hypothetical protein U0325_34335 [Polyangiales bacterium]